ncbi:MAG: SpoIVB peptidase S55 domain-containing protein, partial [Eubacteriales bacterium]
MNHKKLPLLHAALIVQISAALLLGAADYCIDDTLSLRPGETPSQTALLCTAPAEQALPASTGCSTAYYAKVFGAIPLKKINVQHVTKDKLCPGGMPFGVKMFTDGLIVTGFGDVDCSEGARQPAFDAGIRVKDIILKINGTPVTSAESMIRLIESGGGNPIEITVLRNQEELSFTVFPSFSVSESQYKTGMWVRDNTAGIGTITYIDPSTGEFAGLGHGICDTETGTLLPLSRGIIVDVSISGVQKGESGAPGELKGYFTSGKRGSLIGNSDAGVYGVLTSLPPEASQERALPIALKEEIRDGEAQLYCTLDGSGIHGYKVSIRKIKNALDNKNMEILVTDPALLEITGGIVQGMSGSP